MAVSVQIGGTFTQDPGQLPGLYVRFIQKAIAAISVGSRSKVATLKFTWDTAGGTAVANKVYRVTNLADAQTLFGATYVDDIKNMIIGGASEVVVTTVTEASPETGTNWTAALQMLETYQFHVYVNPPSAPSDLVSDAYTWVKSAKTDGLNFVAVFADPASEGSVSALTTFAGTVKDEYVVFVGGGVTNPDGSQVTGDMYACYIAGLIAGTRIDGSLTYAKVPFAETITRYRNPDVKTLLAAGVLVTVMDGDTPKIEQGLTLGDTSKQEFDKIRTVRAKQQMIDDINSAVNENYIGKITNNPDGQIAVINAIKGYLQTLADANVVGAGFTVALDKTQASTGSNLYIVVGVTFFDSIEYVYLTINI